MKFLLKEEPFKKAFSNNRIGVLITNLGSPDQPTFDGLKVYLKEFLSDKRVVETCPFIWFFILNFIILNFRPGKSAALYQKVWTGVGSPLIVKTQQLANQVFSQIQNANQKEIFVEIGMRYGNPSIALGLQKLRQKQCSKIIVLPLYPQHAAATTASTLDAVCKEFLTWRNVPDFHFIRSYSHQDIYIQTLANRVLNHWKTHKKAQKLIMSFHGIPVKSSFRGDPYYCECVKTAKALAQKLNLKKHEWQFTFQSRFGKEEWLKPYTDKTLENLPKENITSIDVICPGFSIDCLETLEEIKIENRDIFLESGGKEFSYIECLNENEDHAKMLSEILKPYLF